MGAVGETVTGKAGFLGWGLVVILLQKSQVGLGKVPAAEGGGAPHNCSQAHGSMFRGCETKCHHATHTLVSGHQDRVWLVYMCTGVDAGNHI